MPDRLKLPPDFKADLDLLARTSPAAADDPSTKEADEKPLWVPRCPLCDQPMGLNHALRHNPQRAYQCVNPDCKASQKATKGAKVKRIGG